MKGIVTLLSVCAFILTACSAWDDETPSDASDDIAVLGLAIGLFRERVNTGVDAYFDCKVGSLVADTSPCFARALRRLEHARTDVSQSLDEVLAEGAPPTCERRLRILRKRVLGAIDRGFDSSYPSATGPEEQAEARRLIHAAFEPIEAAYSSARAECGS